ncbi:VCBS repeat-containing protein [uncultured Polaribacter sp.]|uniref:VCBS repeat-containing protein n=1 Tax=uncultured Polaribacter sp. TaxID=174711 RepID=UPI0026381C4B|nr:VCBS repeat-containing protein [uncultured Polaribacter sp.]
MIKKNWHTYIFCSLFLVLACCKNDVPKNGMENSSEAKEPKIFELIPSEESGISFNNKIDENFKNFFAVFNYVYNGGGVAVGDINNDGLEDLYFTGNEVSNKLYLNKGNFKFEDITESANVSGGKGWHNGVVMTDVNNDGFIDIYVCRGGWQDKTDERANLLFINQGDHTFKEEAQKYGLADEGYSLMASFFDADNDNDLDMYLTNRPKEFFLNYKKVLEGKQSENTEQRDKLYINNEGVYQEVGKKAGIKNNYGYGLGLITSDIDNDGFDDVYVSNDYLEKDYMYINQKDGTFKESLKHHFKHIPMYGMGVDFVDFNNDGLEDLMQLDMAPEDYARSKTSMASMNTQLFADMVDNGFYYQYMHNMLQLNRGNGIFSDIGQYSGIAKTDWSWSCLGTDFDNDGFRDLYITNGFRRDVSDQDSNTQFRSFMKTKKAKENTREENAQYIINLFQENKIANYIFKNNGDLTFSKKNNSWLDDSISFSNGAATADLDNDGDMDIIVNNIEDKAFIYKNTSEKLNNNYLKIILKGPEKNSKGLGARITIKYDDRMQYHQLKTVRGYLSSVSPITHFGLGKTTKINDLTIVWKDGSISSLRNIDANQTVNIDYKNAVKQDVIVDEKNLSEKKLLVDVTDKILSKPFKHKEQIFDDFKNQILLPHKLSQEGPCLAVADVNNDGLDDFFVGGAKNQSGEIYLQDKNATFSSTTQNGLSVDSKHEDVGAVFFDADNDNDQDLYVVSGSNEFYANSPILQDRLYINDGKGNFTLSTDLPRFYESGSCVVPLDFDADGDLDLFIGGRVIPNKYGFAPRSFLLENTNGKFENVTKEKAPELARIGMVSSGVWADIDGDRANELILVGEWMPITVFKKENEILINKTTEFNLQDTKGWWNKIVADDIDNDGDIDFVVGNLGLNYKFGASLEKPFKTYISDFDKNDTNDIFLTKEYQGKLVPVRGKQCSSQQVPEIAQKFETYSQFANAGIEKVLGNIDDENTLKLEVQEFASVVLENDSGKFIIKELPTEAQFSVINSIEITDLNEDGIKDIIIAGNKYEVEVETTRADASIGLVMLGAQNKTYTALPYSESGFFVSDNIKSMAKLKDFNNKTIILCGVNNGKLLFFK